MAEAFNLSRMIRIISWNQPRAPWSAVSRHISRPRGCGIGNDGPSLPLHTSTVRVLQREESPQRGKQGDLR
jgi:hypothetical protein